MGSTVTVKLAVEQYLMNQMENKTTSAEALVIVYDSGVYDKFSGATGSAMTVARGALEMTSPQWSGDENLGFSVNGVFHIVWA